MEVTLPAQVAIKQMRTLLAGSLRFPEQGQSAQGQSVPKARPNGVADGKQANIPAPLCPRYHDGVTQKDRSDCDWKCSLKRVGGGGRQIRCPSTPRRDLEAARPQSDRFHAAEKNL